MYICEWRYRSTHSYPCHYMRGECTGSCYCCFKLHGRSPLNPLNRKPDGPQRWSGHFGENTNLLPQANQPQDYSLCPLSYPSPQPCFILTSLCGRTALLSFEQINWKPLMSRVHQGFLKSRKVLFIAAYPMSSMA
jgi:hypothetical protein